MAIWAWESSKARSLASPQLALVTASQGGGGGAPGAAACATHGTPAACRRLASAITISNALRDVSMPAFMVLGSSTQPWPGIYISAFIAWAFFIVAAHSLG